MLKEWIGCCVTIWLDLIAKLIAILKVKAWSKILSFYFHIVILFLLFVFSNARFFIQLSRFARETNFHNFISHILKSLLGSFLTPFFRNFPKKLFDKFLISRFFLAFLWFYWIFYLHFVEPFYILQQVLFEFYIL